MSQEKPLYIHAPDVDKETKDQFLACAEAPFVTAAALMPDAHHGYVAPIGSVFLTQGYVVPAWVGYDIGCGLIAVRFEGEGLVAAVREHADAIYEAVSQRVPMGPGKVNHVQSISKETRDAFKGLLRSFREGPYEDSVGKYLRDKALAHLGSLGGGNHFIELGYHGDALWLIIHSGSRGVGHTLATRYMQEASGEQTGYEQSAPLALGSKVGKEYMNLLAFGMEFALLNRLEMAYTIRDVLREELSLPALDFTLWANQHHNHALETEDGIMHRKGATPAGTGERGIIPANMRDGTYLVEGLGDPEFLNSSSHGAGRAMSRQMAKKSLSLDTFTVQMEHITGTVGSATLDEAPDAYKPIDAVMEAQRQSVRPWVRVLPLINWKGG